MNAFVAIQDQLKTIEVSTLISCIASICHVYMKFPLKIKDSTFNSQANIGNIAKS